MAAASEPDWDTVAGQEIESRLDVLYLTPGPSTSAEPVIDELTRKMTAAFRASESTGVRWRGVHFCRCGVNSDNTDYILPGGRQTNSLCIHYLAFHRDEVPGGELAKVAALEAAEAEPSAEELARPAKRHVSRYEQLTGINPVTGLRRYAAEAGHVPPDRHR